MITYDYRCECGNEWEARRERADRVMACPSCGQPTPPRIHAPALHSKRKTEGKR